jgi:hypothetical protein
MLRIASYYFVGGGEMEELKDKYVTVEEAAKLAKRKASLIRVLCREGRFPGAVKMGNAWIIPKQEAEAYRPAKKGAKPKQRRLAAEKAAILEAAKSSHRGEETP